MHLGRLILRELSFRKGNFLLGLLSVVAAVVCVVGVLAARAEYDRKTEHLAADFAAETESRAAAREESTRKRMAQLQEDFRKLTLKMGFTTVIVHKDQDLSELFSKGYATHEMPEEYADRIAQRKAMTINHALPTLQSRMPWPERENFLVQLIGVKGEVYVQEARQIPLLEKVPPGGVVIGKEIARRFALKEGDAIVFAGRDFKVAGIRPGKGGSDDVGLWINLDEAQKILNKPGKINAIMAVECMCPGDRTDVIYKELSPFMPDIRVYEFSDVAEARSQARTRVNAAAKAAREQEIAAREAELAALKTNRDAVKRERESLWRVLLPVVIAVAMAWIAMLTMGNARDRGGEIGILRAIGLRTRQVLAVFLGKAALMGFAGGLLGVAAGAAVGALTGAAQIDWLAAGAALLAAPVLAVLASLIPAALAARRDPAVMLRED